MKHKPLLAWIVVTKITDIVKAGKPVKFIRYQKNELWYSTDCGFEFPVPISDTGDAAFLPEDKPMLFMRWMNAHMKTIEKAKLEQEVTIG